MAYLGRNPAIGTQKVLDSLESQFNGVLTTFNLRYTSNVVYPTLSSSLIVSLGGVLQEPGTAYDVASDQITFATAPGTGTDCWILLYSEFGAQAAATPSLTVANNAIIGGELHGPANFIIDPAVIGANTGTVEIKGNLTVQGTTTTINSTVVDLDTLSLGDNEKISLGAGGVGDNGGAVESDLEIYSDGTNAYFDSGFIASSASPNIYFRTSASTTLDTNALTILNSGNVGIGTTSPARMLDVNGDASINSLRIGRGKNNVASNTALGDHALHTNTTGAANTAVGLNTLYYVTTGSNNTAIGNRALQGTTGGNNTAVGAFALFTNNAGNDNTAVGYLSLYYNQTGNNNTAVGRYALVGNTTGSKNIGIGYTAGDAITTGSNNTIIGDVAGTTTLSDTVIIAAGTSERLRIDSSGRLLVGTDSTVFDNNFGIGMLQVTNKTGYQHVLISGHSAAAANATCLSVGRSRGTQASPGYLQSDDHISRFSAVSYNGGNYQTAAAIDFFAADNHASNDLPGYISFKTVPDGSATITERLRITSAGAINIGIGTESTNAANLAEMYVGATDESYATIRGKYNRTNEYNRSEVRFGVENNSSGLGFLAFATGNNSATERLRIDSDGHVTPGDDDTQDLGSTSKRWRNIYTGDLQLSNEGSSNEVDGTWGNYTIQEGEEELFIINRRSGKKFKFVLEEVK